MSRIIRLAIFLVLITAWFAAAEEVRMVLGPLVDGNPGTIFTYPGAMIHADLWIRTETGINIQALHLPISTKNELIGARLGGDSLFSPILHWDDVSFLDPNDDPLHDGYTNQSMLGLCALLSQCAQLIDTHGMWTRITTIKLRAAYCDQCDGEYNDAFAVGYHPINLGSILVDPEAVEIDHSSYSIRFPNLHFAENPCSSNSSGDFNGDGHFNMADISDSFDKLKHGNNGTACLLECPLGSGIEWPVAMDLNGSCSFNLTDVVIAYRKIRGEQIEFVPCQYCPPY